jgi:hypothetical protein
MKLCNEVLKLLNEKGFKLSGTTSTNGGHSHQYKIDDKGNGETSMDNEHKHRISNYEVEKINEHIHTLESV